jgi:hypothetical protein
MVSKVIPVMLVTVLLHGSLVAQAQPQSPAQSPAEKQQVLRRAEQKGKDVKVTLERKIDNQRKFTGKVSQISDSGFTLTNQKTGKTKLAYEDVQQVQQKGLSKGWKIALGVTAGVVLGAILVGETILRDD